jgi:hypothetical protein
VLDVIVRIHDDVSGNGKLGACGGELESGEVIDKRSFTGLKYPC